MNIVLIGYRGAGKSIVGSLLSEELHMRLVSMDEEVVRTAGMSIPEIVDQHGWDDFRDRETVEAQNLAGLDELVIDCGGGVIERQENIEILRQNALVFWLKASTSVVVERIQEGTERPALVDGKTFTEEVAEVLERRAATYRKAAHHEIETDRLTPDQVAEAIILIWKDVNAVPNDAR